MRTIQRGLRASADVVLLQFRGNRADLRGRIDRFVNRRRVDQMQQQARPRQVTQELVAEPDTLGCAFDETGDIGDHEAPAFAHAHRSQVGMQRRERIVGDLRPRVGHGRDQRRFAGVGHAEQADVRKHAKFEMQPPLFALLAACELAWRAVGARLEVEVAEAAGTALGEQQTLAVAIEIGDQGARFVVIDDRAHGEAQLDVPAGGAIAVRAAAVFAICRRVPAREAIVDERVDVAVSHAPDAAAPAAIAAVRPALGNELLATKRGAAIAAMASHHLDSRFVDELHQMSKTKKPCRMRQGSCRKRGRPGS